LAVAGKVSVGEELGQCVVVEEQDVGELGRVFVEQVLDVVGLDAVELELDAVELELDEVELV
jgi:hypothetical protein